MALRGTQKDIKLLTAAVATGIQTQANGGTGKNGINVTDFRNAGVIVGTSGTATATIKFKGAVGSVPPDFSSAASSTNQWEYVQCVDLQNGNPINGTTGIIWTGADAVRFVELNLNVIDWLAVDVIVWSQGPVTATMTVTTNE